MRRLFTTSLISASLMLAACGGGGSSAPSGTGAGTGGGGGSTSTGPASTVISPANPVAVVAGRPTDGVDINVAPQSGTLNVDNLGVADLGAGGSATNSGARIQRGAAKKVILFGAGLDGSVSVTVGGPQDIIITNIRSITSSAGNPGVAFDAAVSPTAAIGGRTVIIRKGSDLLATFTGGLEVVQ